ncbi:MAG: hypothetical protein ICV73_09250 [Acetobacteraceae bacterium]|nr:hypothetical protein [Acetobacteraceae bacterium]
MPPLLGPLLAVGCAIAPPPPSPDPMEGGLRAEGKLDGAGPAEAAFCMSREVPLSYVLLISDGAAVRPAPGVWPAIEPDYALTVRHAEGGVCWLRQVGETAHPATAAAIADRLDRALAACAPVLGEGKP